MSGLSMWTVRIDFLALAASLWLGLYIVTRSPTFPASWLAGGALWSLGGYFLDSFLHLNPPQERVLAWWTGWSILFSAPLWLHLSTLLLSRPGGWRRLLVGTVYGLAAALLAAELGAGLVFGVWTGAPFVYTSAQQPGPLYPLLFMLLTFCPALAALNLYRGWQQSSRPALRRQFVVLLAATGLSMVAGAYLTASVWLRIDAPLLPGHATLAVALGLLGYGVARYNALVEGHARRGDFAYSLLAITAIVLLYLLVAYLSYLIFDISPAVFVFVLMLVILSHSLYEWGGMTLERLFYRRRYRELWTNLRSFAREAEDADLASQLGPVLEVLCRSLDCQWAWIALHREGAFDVVAVHPAGFRPREVGESALLADQVMPLDTGGPGPGQAVVVPLRMRGEQLGAAVLGEKSGEQGRAYTDDELDVLEMWADHVASIVYALRQQGDAVRQIETLVSEFREREQAWRREIQSVLAAGEREALVELSQGKTRPMVEDALRHLYDYAYLGEQELAQLGAIRQYLHQVEVVTHLDRGRALSQLLIDVIEKLRPPGPEPRELSREWIQYTILNDAYVRGEPNRDIMNKLYISESTFNRARRRAVRGVARAIEEIERAARGS
jgi:hypothetical protein